MNIRIALALIALPLYAFAMCGHLEPQEGKIAFEDSERGRESESEFRGDPISKVHKDLNIIKSTTILPLDESSLSYAHGTISAEGKIELKEPVNSIRIVAVVFRDGDFYARDLSGSLYDHRINEMGIGTQFKGEQFSSFLMRIHVVNGVSLGPRYIDNETHTDYRLISCSFKPENQMWYNYKFLFNDTSKHDNGILEEEDIFGIRRIRHSDASAFSGIGKDIFGVTYRSLNEGIKNPHSAFEPFFYIDFRTDLGGDGFDTHQAYERNLDYDDVDSFLEDFRMDARIIFFIVTDYSDFLDHLGKVSETNSKRAEDIRKEWIAQPVASGQRP